MIRSEAAIRATTHVPIRTCVACRSRRSQHELVRYRAVADALVEGDGPGRGAYVCPGSACFDRAVARKAFARALPRPIVADGGKPSDC